MPLLPKQDKRKNFQRKYSPNFVQIVRDTYGKDWFERTGKLAKMQPMCEHPGCKLPSVDSHHIRSLSRGGQTANLNLLRLCDKHHQQRHKHKLEKRKPK